MGLQKGLTIPKITPSNIDVADFPKRNLNIRTTIGELIKLVDAGKTTDGTVAVLDARQPPTPFYFDNISEYTSAISNYALKQIAGTNLPEWSDSAFMPIDFNGGDKNGDNTTSTNASKIKAFVKNGFPYPVNISAKAAAFDGEIKGSLQIKGKNSSGVPFNIAGPAVAWMKPVGSPTAFMVFKKYKEASELAFPPADWNNDGIADNVTAGDMVARALPDKNQTIITYCNSGAMAAFYWFYLTEVLGYTDVRLYDGSWIEWGSSVAFEPNSDNTTEGLKVVGSEIYSWFPKYGATTLNSPKLLIFGSGDFTFFHIENRNGELYAVADNVSMTSVSYFECKVTDPNCPVQLGGNLSGNTAWDTISRSERVVFRADSLVNTGTKGSSDSVSNTKEYNSTTMWPIVTTYPYYVGDGSETKVEDESYSGYSGGGSSSAPEAFVPKGGGC
ncbi:hypothetical protein DSN97_01850 [Deferribacteraceae bacterium V6Fe1]|nr:hypothetical protein DSN97_01850 [Deferribacteraceae bacterium V6Fe1]